MADAHDDIDKEEMDSYVLIPLVSFFANGQLRKSYAVVKTIDIT